MHVAASRGRPDASAGRTSPWPARSSAGSRGSRWRRVWPHDRLVPGTARRPARRPRFGMTAAAELEVVVIGAGPAGLTAACELARHGVATTVLEADDGRRRDQPHRRARRLALRHRRPPVLHQGAARCEELWHEILPDDDFLLRPRLSRIYYRGAVLRLPAARARTRCATSARSRRPGASRSYVWARVRPPEGPDRTSRAGSPRGSAGGSTGTSSRRYTEKVWGVPADRDPGRLGRAADQEPVARPRRCSHALRPEPRQAEQHGDQPDRASSTTRSRARA